MKKEVIYFNLVTIAKQMIKNINSYLGDYQTISEGCKNDKGDKK